MGGRQSLAIIGSGIAGLGCAHFLQHSYDLTVFEADRRIGGHAHTVWAGNDPHRCPVDTGFMVFNKVTYPHLTRLFTELDVPIRPTDMSFSVQSLTDGLEYCGSSMNLLFSQRRNLLSPRFWGFLNRIHRFNREAVEALQDSEWDGISLGDYVERRQYGRDFLHWYLLPMSGAVWSAEPAEMLTFPATTLLRFFHNHGFLGLHTQHPWWTVQGGSEQYVQRLTHSFQDRLRMNTPVTEVRRSGGRAQIRLTGGATEVFDHVVLATQADQALRLLGDATIEEQRLLGAFQYSSNLATLHTDASVMPKNKRAWAAWNQRLERKPSGERHCHTVYWMNQLQALGPVENYFVSLNGDHAINPSRVKTRLNYRHPLFDRAAVAAQPGLRALNQRPGPPPVLFCGSYFRYGFHEDALGSAMDVVESLTGAPAWTHSTTAARPQVGNIRPWKVDVSAP